MAHPKVSIIILNWNGKKYLKECLDSVFKINYKNYVVYFVDNASSDDSVSFVKQIYASKLKSKLKIIVNDKNYGFAEGNNIAIKKVLKDKNVKYICLLNNDTKVDNNFLTELIKVAESDKKIGIVGSKIYYMDEPNKISFAGGKVNLWTGRAFHIGDKEIDKGQYDVSKKIDYVTGASMCIKREVLERIGLFPKEFFCYWEDTDLSFRARKADYKLWYVPNSKVWHKVSGSNNVFQIYYFYRNNVFFMKRNATKIQFLIFIPIKLLYLFIATIFFKPFSKEKWKGFFHGFFKTFS